MHLVAHDIESALDERVIGDRNAMRATRRAALHNHTHGTNSLSFPAVWITPPTLKYPVAPLVNHTFSGRSVNGGASAGAHTSNEVSRYRIGAESKPATSARQPPAPANAMIGTWRTRRAAVSPALWVTPH